LSLTSGKRRAPGRSSIPYGVLHQRCRASPECHGSDAGHCGARITPGVLFAPDPAERDWPSGLHVYEFFLIGAPVYHVAFEIIRSYPHGAPECEVAGNLEQTRLVGIGGCDVFAVVRKKGICACCSKVYSVITPPSTSCSRCRLELLRSQRSPRTALIVLTI